MHFDFVGWLMNPYILMFVAVFTGLLFGKIKFGKFNFGVSGTLFTGLVLGWWALGYAKGFGESDAGFKAATNLIKSTVIPKEFFTIFLILFVASVGLLAAKDMAVVLKKYGLKFIILGVVITFVGAATTYGATVVMSNANPYEVSGVYTGALTSSPGLAAAIETAQEHSTEAMATYASMTDKEKAKILNRIDPTGGLTPENTPDLTADQKKQYIVDAQAGIGVGHAIGYPFGVLIVIIAVNFFPRIFGIDVEKEHEELKRELHAAKKMIMAES